MPNIILRQDQGNTEPRSANVVIKGEGLSNIELDNNINNLNNSIEQNQNSIETLIISSDSNYNFANNIEIVLGYSFQQANIAFEQANTGVIQAQAAFASANNVAPQIEPAFNTANAGVVQAQAAFGRANSAYDSANTGIIQAQAAFASANNVAPQIEPSFIQANTGVLQAQAAFGRANSAYDQANTGVLQAEAAFDSSNTKFSSSGGTISGSVEISSNLLVTGNLTVSGNVTTVSANNLVLQDNIIYLNDGNTVANPDLGLSGNYNDGVYHHAGFFRDATDGYWKIFDQYVPEPDASPYIDTSDSTFRIANFQANNITGNTFSGVSNNSSYLNGYNSNYFTNASNILSGTLSNDRLSSIPNSSLANTTITINGTSISLGGSGNIIAGATITDDTTTNDTRYLMLGSATSGAYTSANVSSTKLTFNPSTGLLSATGFSGSGSNLTSLTAANLSGTIPSGVLGNSTLYVGTTAISLNRSSTSQSLTGISSIDGSAATLTTARTLTIGSTGKSFNGSGNVSWSLNEIGAYANTNPNGYTTNTGTVTSVGGTGTVSGLSLSGTVTTSGNLTLGGTLSVAASNFSSQTANQFLAAPNGSAGTPTFRAIVAADVPTLNQNTTGSSGSCTGNAATATTASQVTVNYNNNSASTYQMLWGSGNSVYGTAEIYCNPSTDYLYSGSFYCGNWFRSSGATGWYNESYGGGIHMSDSTWVRVYNNKQFYSQNYIQSDSSLRAPIFYDSNDTYYYNDPNSSRRFAGRTYIHEWIEFVNYTGLYSPNNGAHFYPNNSTYGSWRCDGSRNGWQGIEFTTHTTLMMNDDTYGFHKQGTGWRFYVTGGSGHFPGNVTAYWSDRRLKENLRPIGKEATDILSQLTTYRFNWNKKVKEFNLPIEVGKEEIGLIAQDVQKVLPDAVVVNKSANTLNEDGTTNEKDYLTINWDKITPLLVQSLNDTIKELNELKQKLKDNGIL